ncbi:MAG TPA: J domain-containing protein [bacterium]|nr:J domain-containing protein [bacterium]
MKLRDQEITDRARKVLDIAGEASPEEIKQAYRKKAKQVHPDIGERDERIMGAINQAYARLTPGKSAPTSLLENDKLVQMLINLPVDPIEQTKTYEEWMLDRFYNLGSDSIWPE